MFARSCKGGISSCNAAAAHNKGLTAVHLVQFALYRIVSHQRRRGLNVQRNRKLPFSDWHYKFPIEKIIDAQNYNFGFKFALNMGFQHQHFYFWTKISLREKGLPTIFQQRKI